MRNDVKQVQQADLAVVFLAAAWSHVAVAGQRQFENFVSQVADMEAGHANFAILQEESEETLLWLQSLGIPQLPAHHPVGAGSIVWLKHGKLVGFDMNINTVSQEAFVAKLRQL